MRYVIFPTSKPSAYPHVETVMNKVGDLKNDAIVITDQIKYQFSCHLILPPFIYIPISDQVPGSRLGMGTGAGVREGRKLPPVAYCSAGFSASAK
jgi:hypothetical protein